MALFMALAAAVFYTLLISFADATAGRIMVAYYEKQRKQISRKARYVLSGRSRCEQCQHTLGPQDLVPIFSYLLLSGRCRHCQAPFGKRFFWFEVTAFFYGLAIGYFHPDYFYIACTGFYLVLLTIAMRIDYNYFLIPTEIIFVLLLSALAELFTRLQLLPPATGSLQGDYTLHLLVAFCWYFLFYLVRILSRYQLGLADVRLVLALGIGLGYPLSIYLPTLAAALGLAFYLLNRYLFKTESVKDRGLKTRLAFGVFLGCSFLLLRIL